MAELISPHGGELIDLLVDSTRAAALRIAARDWPSWDLNDRQLNDLELLMSGGFSPLRGFMSRADYEAVVSEMRLADGTLWPVPVTLDVSEAIADDLAIGDSVALRDPEGLMLAVLHVEDIWAPDLEREAAEVFGSTDPDHPAVDYLFNRSSSVYIGGRLEGVQLPPHYDYQTLRLAPRETREQFTKLGWTKVVAFQTRNPMHRAHVELTLRASKESGADLFIHPVVGLTKPGDVDHYTRVRAYQSIIDRYPTGTALLSLLPLAMRLAGPREAVWHAIIRKNHGVTHFIVGRDHAGPGVDASGEPFYGPYDAQDLLREFEGELGVTMIPFQMMVYLPDEDRYLPIDEVPDGVRTLSISGTELRERLQDGREIPDWFTYPEVAAELRKTHPPRYRQGLTVFLTGLSGAGKSTIANALVVKLLELGGRPVTLLDGDIVRKELSSELGFSKEHRNLNVRRIGYVASEITKNGGIAICAPIAPYEAVRRRNRELIEPLGGYILVYLSTPLEVCEQRDRKGLYAKARAGLVKEFTGVSDPYEEPMDADLTIDTSDVSPEEAANMIMLHLERFGYIDGASEEG